MISVSLVSTLLTDADNLTRPHLTHTYHNFIIFTDTYTLYSSDIAEDVRIHFIYETDCSNQGQMPAKLIVNK